MKYLFFGILCLFILSSDCQEIVTVHEVVTVLGMLTNLPCNITPPYSNDQVNLVLWYKDGYGKPFFGFDLRKSAEGGLLTDTNDTKVKFNALSEPTAVLSLYGVTVDDAGLYKCRVDFKRSPTRYWKVNLTVIVPPTSSMILDERGLPIVGDFFSADEFSTLLLTCDVLDGMPASRAEWWKNGQIYDQTYKVVTVGKSRNSLKINNLKRSDDGTELICAGSNNNESQPVTTSITLRLNLSPVKTRLGSIREQLVVGKSYELSCKSYGGSPEVEITWIMDDEELDPIEYQSTLRKDGNMTESILIYKPRVKHHNKTLRCRSRNPRLSPISTDEVMLKIQYSPVVELRLGKSLKETEINEGDDVYFECDVNANPLSTRVKWKFEDKEIKENIAEGVRINSLSLVLKNITKNARGKYSCIAQNEIGIGSSSEIFLNVKYVPYCYGNAVDENGQGIGITGIPLEDKLNIKCEVESNPPPTNFVWMFNTSTEMWNVPKSDIIVDGFNSIASVVVHEEDVFQNLLCWAENDIGKQQTPCLYYLIPASEPGVLEDCKIANKSYSSLAIQCVPGKSGILQQSFIAEVYSADFDELDGSSGGLKSNFAKLDNTSKNFITSVENLHFPHFIVSNLHEGGSYVIHAYAVNPKGASKAQILTGTTLKKAERQIDPNEISRFDGFLSKFHFLSIFITVTVILTGILCLVILTTRVLLRPDRHSRQDHILKLNETKKPPSDCMFIQSKDSKDMKWQLENRNPHDQSWEVRSESAMMPNMKEDHCDTNSFDEALLQIPDQEHLIDKLLHTKQLEGICTKLTRF